MDNTEDDDDLKLIKASAGLLEDFEQSLPKVLWKQSPKDKTHHTRQCHRLVRKRDLDYLISLLEPFQGEPQLLDSKLKIFIPEIVGAYLQIPRESREHSHEFIESSTAICTLLYTFCKIRGYKVIVGFFNNEPRYLVRIIHALEHASELESTPWQVSYILLLWLSHLLLTPFDLTSISTEAVPFKLDGSLQHSDIPPLMLRTLNLGLKYLPAPTKVQDAASAMLMRLVTRPDAQKFKIADVLVEEQLRKLRGISSGTQANMYETLGSIRFLCKVVTFAELGHLVPQIYRSCQKHWEDGNDSVVMSNAVAKKITIKIFRNITILSLRATSTGGPLTSFLESTGVLEDVIDHLLQSLADKDTPVRYAAAKAISLVVLELESDMGHEVIQAVLDTFKEDIPRSASSVDFTTADPLKWHGLTLTLAHALYTRSASPEQMADILVALISASQFQQRTVTGTALGTNVRDAANFGIWSLARRYTTSELSAVSLDGISPSLARIGVDSVVQVLAVQLLLSACLDPAGNIRRGSSAALQELIGRHPDQVVEGIALVQVVDYQAVGLRRRAMNDVALNAAGLDEVYWRALLEGLLGWRGLGSADVPARESAAQSISNLATRLLRTPRDVDVLQKVQSLLQHCPLREVEDMHGLTLAAAKLIDLQTQDYERDKSLMWRDGKPTPVVDLQARENEYEKSQLWHGGTMERFWSCCEDFRQILKDPSSRVLRAELPASISRYISAVSRAALSRPQTHASNEYHHKLPWALLNDITELILGRHEDWILSTVPMLATSQFKLRQRPDVELGAVSCQQLISKVAMDHKKSSLFGAGRAVALGALAQIYGSDETEMAMDRIATLLTASNVDWRVIGVRAIRLFIGSELPEGKMSSKLAVVTCHAICHGLRDYTIDERGDVGSLVRLQAVSCTTQILATRAFSSHNQAIDDLKANIYRLSLEKLDRVRLMAAQGRSVHLRLSIPFKDIGSASSLTYLAAALEPMVSDSPLWLKRSIIEGSISCCGSGSESLIQASRSALASHLWHLEESRLSEFMDVFAAMLKDPNSVPGVNLQGMLDFLGFLLDARLVQHMTGFKWRNLLSSVQKSHYKSNDVPKIMAAVHVYSGLAEVPAIKGEVIKKLVAMLKTNPYPRVRIATAEALWLVTHDSQLHYCNWAKPAVGQDKVIAHLHAQYVVPSI